MKATGIGIMLVAVSLLLCVPAEGQVVREQDTISVAGLLEGAGDVNSYWFEGREGQILYASIDSSIYQNHGRKPSHDSGDDCGDESTEDQTVGESCDIDSEGGSCSHDDSGGGCSGSDAGSLHIKLELINSEGAKVCHAGRPNYPGWQRDPRLICVIDVEDTYTLKVLVGGMGEASVDVEGAPTSEQVQIPYLLNVSLRDVVNGGSLEDARDDSKNEF